MDSGFGDFGGSGVSLWVMGKWSGGPVDSGCRELLENVWFV